MYPQLMGSGLSAAARLLGNGGRLGGLGMKAQNALPSQFPNVNGAPAPMSESLLYKQFGDIQNWLQQKAAAADQAGVDEEGFISAYNPSRVPSVPVPPASLGPIMPAATGNEYAPSPRGTNANASAPMFGPAEGAQGVSGPSLIQRFMDALYNMSPAAQAQYEPQDIHGLKGW